MTKRSVLKPQMKRKLHVKIRGPNHDGKISIDKSQEDIAAGSRVTKIKLAGRGDKGMKFSVERVRGTKRDGKRIRGRGRERAANWLQSCELKTQRRTSRTGRRVGVGRGRVDLRQRAPRKQWLVISSP